MKQVNYVIAGTILLFLVSACTQQESDVHHMAMPEQKTVQQAAPEVGSDVIATLHETAMKMESFKTVRNGVRDLEEIMTVPQHDQRSIYKVSDEIYYYSPSLNKTFVLCKRYNALNAVLDGNAKNMTHDQLFAALKPWQENAKHIMGSMSGEGNMQDMDQDSTGDMKDMQHKDRGMQDMPMQK